MGNNRQITDNNLGLCHDECAVKNSKEYFHKDIIPYFLLSRHYYNIPLNKSSNNVYNNTNNNNDNNNKNHDNGKK